MSWSYSFDSFDRLLRAGLVGLSSDRARALGDLRLACHVYDVLPLELFAEVPGTKTEHLIDLLASYLEQLFARDDVVRPVAGAEVRRLAGFEATHAHIRDFGYFSLFIHLFFGLYRRTSYRFFLELALESCETYRGRLHPIARRIRFWSAMHRWLEVALAEHVKGGEAEQALALVEQMTARGFLDVYQTLATPRPAAAEPVDPYDVVAAIGTQVPEGSLLYPITKAYDPRPLEDFPLYSREQLFQFVDECPVFHQDRWELPQRRTLPVAGIARSLPEAWAYLTYRQVDDHLMCSVLGAGGLTEMFRVDTWEAGRDDMPVLEREFARVLLLLRRLGGSGLPVHQRSLALPDPAAAGEALLPALQELHDLVFRQPRGGSRNPLEALAGVTQLLILPGFPLQDVPIAAAHDGRSFLIERCGVAFVPSGTWFALRRALPEPRPLETALVLTDPTGDLPGARREGELVAGLLRQAGIGVTLREGGQVTRRWFLEAGKDFDLVHYAGHGSFDLARSSFLGFADGPLSLADLLTGPWRPRLVVLNACRSGVRKVHLLDETLSMASGFLAAGVGAVVSTLWPVGDDVALRFAGTLYAVLLQGRSVGEAYQASMVRLIRSHMPPAEWAQYFLAGDPSVRV